MKTSPAYHLRTNKAVERLLFLELLRKLDGKLALPIASYKYVSLGGPYLEDFMLVHTAFGNRSMVSLETKKHVRTRQVINLPYSRIDLTLDSTRRFVDKYSTGNIPLVVWFDYEWQDWKGQLSESCDLLQKLPLFSIFKLTLTGKTDWLGTGGSDPLRVKADKLGAMFADYGPFEPSEVNQDSICRTLYSICRRAIAQAVPDTGRRAVRTLAAYEYNDGTPVLTITMIVGPLNDIRRIVADAALPDWPYAVLNWRTPKNIDVPHLGLRERLAIDKLMPDADARAIVKRLKLRLSDNYWSSVQAINNYKEFYKYVPQFLRVSL
jgi:hypothetical protein